MAARDDEQVPRVRPAASNDAAYRAPLGRPGGGQKPQRLLDMFLTGVGQHTDEAVEDAPTLRYCQNHK
ncbi:hypothetical protein AB0I22_38095 [Streptomyces sp. NPDC050610]|uniref:hypothetical protein n=1 Tax=Streptomyces sp. NPDC050610 TaxID=3157097 RepID=UPI0034268FA4